MIDVKTAIQKAFEFVRDIYSEVETPDLALEEVELSDDEMTWFVTISFAVPGISPFAGLRATKEILRNYKILEIDSGSGAVKSMKIRKL